MSVILEGDQKPLIVINGFINYDGRHGATVPIFHIKDSIYLENQLQNGPYGFHSIKTFQGTFDCHVYHFRSVGNYSKAFEENYYLSIVCSNSFKGVMLVHYSALSNQHHTSRPPGGKGGEWPNQSCSQVWNSAFPS